MVLEFQHHRLDGDSDSLASVSFERWILVHCEQRIHGRQSLYVFFALDAELCSVRTFYLVSKIELHSDSFGVLDVRGCTRDIT